MLRAVSPPTPPRRVFALLSGDQSTGLSALNPVRFDVVENGDIALAGYTFTLPSAGTYSLEGACRFNGASAASGRLGCRWRNVTDMVWAGSTSNGAAQNVATSSSEQPIASALITVTQQTDVALWINNANNVTQILAASSYAKIIQIA